MDLRNKIQNKCSYAIRQKWKRVVAMAMSVFMVTSIIGDGELSYVNAQPNNDVKTITSFDVLGEDIGYQRIIKGSSEADLILPDTMNVIVKSILQEKIDPIGENTESNKQNMSEATGETNTEIKQSAENNKENVQTNETLSSESKQEEIAETVHVESSENYALPMSQEVKTVTQSTTQEDITSGDETQGSTKEVFESVILENISWKQNPASSTYERFDSTKVGAVYLYEPMLPEGYFIAEGTTLPQIKVEIIDKKVNGQLFRESKTIDGIEITVMADLGVFPEGAILNVREIVDTDVQERIEEAVKEEVKAEESTKTVEQLISFDITITDIEGNELQPDTSKGEVKVSFAKLPIVTDVATPEQELKVFHMDDTLKKATGLDTTVNEEAGSVEATAEHFSVYTVAQLTPEIESNVEAMVISANGEEIY